MSRPSPAFTRRPRRGFVLMAIIVASVLACMLMLLLAMSWGTFGRPALEVEARARLTREGMLAAQSLACDLGGFLADAPGQTGTLTQYRLIPPFGLSNPSILLLTFQGASSGEQIFITYQLSGNQLVRSNSSTGATTTIANYVTGFTVTPIPTLANPNAQIQITMKYSYFSVIYSLIGVSP